MSDLPDFVDPDADFDACNPLRPDAVRVTGKTLGGRTCTLIDNTGSHLPINELQAILDALIESKAFGFKTVSPSGASTVDLARREAAHIQIGGTLYRLIVYRYEARIEKF